METKAEEPHQDFKVTDNKSIVDVTKVLNINIGVLGHIDSGKTALSKLISTVASTSAFDKVPQSQERGITLELGFSAFLVEVPEWLKSKHKQASQYTHIQFTLVDCPGHASLIKTIIGGASIIDMMILVVDATKGVQTQTAECLVIGEILRRKLMIALNKVDLFEADQREAKIEAMTKTLQKMLKDSVFGSSVPVQPVIAAVKEGQDTSEQMAYLRSFIVSLLNYVEFPARVTEGPFIFSADHCFVIKGQGTVLTGTVLKGKAGLGDLVEIPAISESRKIKSLQIFKKPVKFAMQGDRVGICVPQLDSKTFERGFVATPGAVVSVESAVIRIKRVKYYKNEVESKAKFHITLGHQTVLGTCIFYTPSAVGIEESKGHGKEEAKTKSKGGLYLEKVTDLAEHYVLVDFETPVFCYTGSIIIGSKLDLDVNTKQCRIAFEGTLMEILSKGQRETFSIRREKVRMGKIEKVLDNNTVLVKDLFKKETNMEVFMGRKVEIKAISQVGTIDSTFGKSGKVKVGVAHAIPEGEKEKLVNSDVALKFEKELFKPKKPAAKQLPRFFF